MKKVLFIAFVAVFFKYSQSIAENKAIYTGFPNCTNYSINFENIENTTFVFVLDRAADWESYIRVLYLYKQFSCMIPIDDSIKIIFLQYTTNEVFLEPPQRSDTISGTIYATGYEQDYYNDDHCTRFNESLTSKLDELVNFSLRKPIQNVQFIVPIYSNAVDAKSCSMKKVFDEKIQAGNNASLLNLHFNGININCTADGKTMKKEGIFMNIPDVRIINPNETFMVGPPETEYTRKLTPIVKELQRFLENSLQNRTTTSTSNSPNFFWINLFALLIFFKFNIRM
ncbi:unnamed protein product [Caenorhabditis angaria]|uniref:VWFA domain-containing protein n=1 Tax=Caenorhabditis angaria TaxID=860376 RepID=A0A9P1IUX4_9PELO|nr:unnamed protein product [Caenorhabditis angaria]